MNSRESEKQHFAEHPNHQNDWGKDLWLNLRSSIQESIYLRSDFTSKNRRWKEMLPINSQKMSKSSPLSQKSETQSIEWSWQEHPWNQYEDRTVSVWVILFFQKLTRNKTDKGKQGCPTSHKKENPCSVSNDMEMEIVLMTPMTLKFSLPERQKLNFFKINIDPERCFSKSPGEPNLRIHAAGCC